MTPLNEFRPKAFHEYIKLVEGFQSKSKGQLWFRGCSSKDYKLIPALYRHTKYSNFNDLIELEYKLLRSFRQRCVPFISKDLGDDWDTLFFMQHYGVPTRLLDWTENPIVAVYFAVMSTRYVFDGTKFVFKNPAAIWVLDPEKWNRFSLKHQSFDGGILTPWEEEVKGYKPTSNPGLTNNHPVALHGTLNSSRIVAQRGVFTIFGKNIDPMEVVYKKENFPVDCLMKIILNQSVLLKIRKSILNSGITESVVFPDLDGLAKELKRMHEF